MKKVFGLDIGATKMKAVWLHREGKGFSFKSAIMVPTPQKGILSDSPLDQEEMSKAIKKMVADAKIGTSDVNIALAENQVYTKVLQMPYLSDKELDEAIHFEAEQYIPVPLQNIALAHTILQKPPKKVEGAKIDLLLVGAPISLIDKYKKVLSMANLNIVTVETEILAIIRALIPNENTPPTLLVNIGAISTSLAIIRRGIMVFSYAIPTGGNAISRAIASDFGFSLMQAEEYKRAYGITNQADTAKLGKTTEPILQTILTEIKKAIAFYSQNYKNEDPIAQIQLTGGTAKLPGIEMYFAQNTGIETAIANPWKMFTNKNLPKELLDNAVDYTVAVGLAMRDYDV